MSCWRMSCAICGWNNPLMETIYPPFDIYYDYDVDEKDVVILRGTCDGCGRQFMELVNKND